MELSNLSEEFNRKVNSAMSIVDNNKIASTILCLFLVLYASLAAPKLPKSVTAIFKNFWFKLIFMFLIAYMATHNPAVAIISAVALLITLQTLHSQDTAEQVINTVENRVKENFQNFASAREDNSEVEPAMSTSDYDQIAGYAPYESDSAIEAKKLNLPEPNVTMPMTMPMIMPKTKTMTMPVPMPMTKTMTKTMTMPVPMPMPKTMTMTPKVDDADDADDTDDVTDTNKAPTVQQPINISTEDINPNLLNTLTEQINQLINSEMNLTTSEESEKSEKSDSDDSDDKDDSDKDDFTNATCNSCSILKENFQDSNYITGTCADTFESLPGYEFGDYSSL